tara:strand:- start:2027 stop:2419 length:393 start_codon:yes stop_codon:yes gene_type:complete
MSTISKLKKKLDKIFSEYIRLRDSDYKGNCKCISCGKEAQAFGGSTHAGHLFSRRYLSIRFDEKNVNAQCSYCNTFLNGNQIKAARGVDNKWGKGTVNELESRMHITTKLNRVDYEEAIEIYKQKIRELN